MCRGNVLVRTSITQEEHGVPLINVKVTDEAYAIAQKRVGYARRGIGNYVTTLILADEARRDERLLAQRRRDQEELTTKDTWRQSGCNVD